MCLTITNKPHLTRSHVYEPAAAQSDEYPMGCQHPVTAD